MIKQYGSIYDVKQPFKSVSDNKTFTCKACCSLCLSVKPEENYTIFHGLTESFQLFILCLVLMYRQKLV